jgi:hypothetical protein
MGSLVLIIMPSSMDVFCCVLKYLSGCETKSDQGEGFIGLWMHTQHIQKESSFNGKLHFYSVLCLKSKSTLLVSIPSTCLPALIPRNISLCVLFELIRQD